jgi:hypothetical protein
LRTVIKLTISGDVFFFEDNRFTSEEKNNLQKVADAISQKHLQQKILNEDLLEINEKEICLFFTNEVKAKLGIDLVQVEVSFVIRINT